MHRIEIFSRYWITLSASMPNAVKPWDTSLHKSRHTMHDVARHKFRVTQLFGSLWSQWIIHVRTLPLTPVEVQEKQQLPKRCLTETEKKILNRVQAKSKHVVWPPGVADRVCPARVQEPNFTGRYSWPWHLIADAELHVLSCCSAVSESDVGDQLVLLSSLAQLRHLDSWPSVSSCKWHPVQKPKNIFCCLPRARLPSIFPVSAIASSSFILSQQMT